MRPFSQQFRALKTAERVLASLELAPERDEALDSLIRAIRADHDDLLDAIVRPVDGAHPDFESCGVGTRRRIVAPYRGGFDARRVHPGVPLRG